MSGIPPKVLGVLLSALTITALANSPASAATGAIDGTISTGSSSCSWTDGVTSDTAPNTLTVDRASVNGNLTCSSGVSATLNNDPTVTFDDASGTAVTDLMDVSITQLGITCRYQGKNITSQRDGDTRVYTASVDIPLYEGGLLCPNPATGTATFTFH